MVICVTKGGPDTEIAPKKLESYCGALSRLMIQPFLGMHFLNFSHCHTVHFRISENNHL
jgi:hypothetical protein